MDQSVEQKIQATTELMWAADREISDREFYGFAINYPHLTTAQLASVSDRCAAILRELNAQRQA